MSAPTFASGFILSVIMGLYSSAALARSVFLNGQDASSARNQYLKKVDIRIDENGNIYIEGPQYELHEEHTYTPLSSWVKEQQTPEHQPRSKMPEAMQTRGTLMPMPPAGMNNPPPETPATSESAIKPSTADGQTNVANPEPKLQDKPGG